MPLLDCVRVLLLQLNPFVCTFLALHGAEQESKPGTQSCKSSLGFVLWTP